MLTEEQLDKLKQDIEEGKMAEQLLEQYKEVKGYVDGLAGWVETWDTDKATTNIKKITFGTGYENKSLHLEDREFARNQMKKIVEHELDILTERLNKISI